MACTRTHTHTHTHTHKHTHPTVGCYLVLTEKEILPFATSWMDLEGIMLDKLRKTQKEKYCTISFHLYVKFKIVKLIEAES